MSGRLLGEPAPIIHGRFCCNRGPTAHAREASFVNRERDKQDLRDRHDQKFTVPGSSSKNLELRTSNRPPFFIRL